MIVQILDVVLGLATMLAAGGVLYLLAIVNTLALPANWTPWFYGLAFVFALALANGARTFAGGVWR